MRLARARNEEPQIGITPLIDVVFLLLIFFMVTTSFVQEAGLAVALPEAGAAEPAPETDFAAVLVDAGDRVFVNDRRVRPGADMRGALAALLDSSDGLKVRADGRASHQAVVAVLDTAATVGFVKIDIATRPAGSGE